MTPGDIHIFNVPFDNRPGGKERPVVILQLLDDLEVAIIQSTSQFKPNLELIHSVDFDHSAYYGVRCSGVSGISYFYRENWLLRPRALNVRRIGKLHERDFEIILRGLDLI